MAQSDWQFNAFNGVSRLDDAPPATNLRSVFGLWPETVTIFAKPGAGISNISDLKGRRVNIGRIDTGTRHYWNEISTAHGWSFRPGADLRCREQQGSQCGHFLPFGKELCILNFPGTYRSRC